MNVISRRRLREFYEGSSERKRHAQAFENWFKLARAASWRNFQDARALFGQTDVASDTKSKGSATIFDIGGNKYRIVSLIDYKRQTVLITHVLDHKEYDRGHWKLEILGGSIMTTTTRSIGRHRNDGYLALVNRFPLKPIKNDREHEKAVAVISALLGQELDAGSSDYLDTLVILVNKYEDENHTIDLKFKSPRDALKAIMDANGLTQAEMGKIIGSESALSMFLKGHRELSKAHIKALVSRFRVDASLFL